MDTPPILLISFNRPDLARKVLGAIRRSRPTRLFIAVDGPRAHKHNEAAVCAETRSLASEVDWPCDVKTRFNEENQGCKRAVSGAISWFFEHVESGIILEDDCLPHASFFPYCADMLEHYRDDERVGMISGNNFRPMSDWRESGHEFSIFTFIWGWATWRRAWRCYDGEMSDWPERRRCGWLHSVFSRAEAAEHWTRIFNSCHGGQVDTWDYPWTYSCWKAGYLCIVPSCNLVSNIGFDDRSTHTCDPSNPIARLPVREIIQPRDAPIEPRQDRRQDERYLRSVYGIRFHNWRKRSRLAIRALRDRVADRLCWWALPLMGRRARVRHLISALKAGERFKPGRTNIDSIEWTYPDAPSFAYAYEQIFLRGIYDLGDTSDPLRIIDCGANAGLATLYWKMKYPDSEVVAVEADPAIYRYLEENITRAGVSGVRTLNQAVWHTNGELLFAPQGADGGSLAISAASTPTAELIRVSAVPLQELIGARQVDLLKIDIEGAECDVLIGQEAALAPVQRLFVEYHSYAGRPQLLDELLGSLRRAGFRVQLHPELISQRPFVSRHEEDGMDHRLNIYAWRK